jgi:hypothetical protein
MVGFGLTIVSRPKYHDQLELSYPNSTKTRIGLPEFKCPLSSPNSVLHPIEKENNILDQKHKIRAKKKVRNIALLSSSNGEQ